VVINY